MTLEHINQTSPERYTLVFTDGTELKTTLSVVMECGLYSGMELDSAGFESLSGKSALALCKARALRIINTRAMSRYEMQSKLREKGEKPEHAEYCADWLCELGLISDESYAGMLVRHYSDKGYGRGRIVQELRRRGIAQELWDEALNEMPEPDDKLRRFVETRVSDPSDKAQIQKVSSALYRRGYSWDEIRHAIEEIQ